MNRPILVAVIGYIIGIIWGLYFKISIALLYLFLLLVVAIYKIFKIKNKKRKFKIFYIPRYFRYIKLIFSKKVITVICLFSCISNTIIIFKNNEFANLFKSVEDVELVAIVKDLRSSSDYKNTFEIRVLELNKNIKFKNTNLYLKVDKKEYLSYGSIIKIKGKYKEPETSKNYKAFNYKNYLKTLNIYGIIDAEHIEYIKEDEGSKLGKAIYEFKKNIKERISIYLDKEVYGIFLGIILGDTSKIEDEIKDDFKNSNMSHILAVSGMHISYITLIISFLLIGLIGKKWSKIMTIIFLVLYLVITGFSPSIIRAVIMASMALIGSLIHRKGDFWSSIALSLFIILIYNPFLITSISLQYSYLGTIGIIYLNKTVLSILNKGESNKSKLKEIVSVSISAQIFILPITLYHFNTFGVYFLLTNLCISFLMRSNYIIGVYVFGNNCFKLTICNNFFNFYRYDIKINIIYK